MDKKIITDALWAGTEAAHHTLMQLEAQAQARINAGWSEDDEEEDDDLPYLLSISDDGTATVSIAGPMTNSDKWYYKYFSIASYPAIREALVYAAQAPEVKMILLDINSGGGSVNGVSDTGNLIRLINDKVKPVYAYTDGSMCSAAYWLGCSAEQVFSSSVSTVGSIGVIATHLEYSKQLEEDGVKATVMRSGKYKALVNPYEPLTAEAKQQFQEQLDAAYKVFATHVAVMRGKPYDHVDGVMGQGREFFGEAALAAGLVDGIEAYDSLLSRLKAKILDDSTPFGDTSRSNLTQGVYMNKKKALTEQDIAALASGVAVQADAAQATGDQVAAEQTAQASTQEAPANTDKPTTEGAAETNDKLPQAATSEVISFLQAQVKDKDEAIIAANVEIAGLKGKLNDYEASVSGLMTIAAKSIGNMRIAMGGSSLDITGMTATQVLAEHQKVSEQFAKTFPVGGVAAVDAATDNKATVVADPLWQARLASVRMKPAK